MWLRWLTKQQRNALEDLLYDYPICGGQCSVCYFSPDSIWTRGRHSHWQSCTNHTREFNSCGARRNSEKDLIRFRSMSFHRSSEDFRADSRCSRPPTLIAVLQWYGSLDLFLGSFKMFLKVSLFLLRETVLEFRFTNDKNHLMLISVQSLSVPFCLCP